MISRSEIEAAIINAGRKADGRLSNTEYLNDLQFATNARGERMMSVDPVYRKHVESEMARLRPGGPEIINPQYTATDNPPQQQSPVPEFDEYGRPQEPEQ